MSNGIVHTFSCLVSNKQHMTFFFLALLILLFANFSQFKKKNEKKRSKPPFLFKKKSNVSGEKFQTKLDEDEHDHLFEIVSGTIFGIFIFLDVMTYYHQLSTWWSFLCEFYRCLSIYPTSSYACNLFLL